MNLIYTIFATRINNNIAIGYININGESSTTHVSDYKTFKFFTDLWQELSFVNQHVNSVTVMFREDDELSFAFLDALIETDKKEDTSNLRRSHSFDASTKTLYFNIGKIQLIIFNFNYEGYIASLQPINLKDDEIVIDDVNVNNTSTALLSFSIIILLNLILIPLFFYLVDSSIF